MRARRVDPGLRKDAKPRQGFVLLFLVLAGFAPSLLGFLDPDRWWGSHSLAFLPRAWAAIAALLAVAAALLLPAAATVTFPRPLSFLRRRLLNAILIAAAYAALCHGLGMATDIYGDARRNLAHVEQLIARGNPGWPGEVFSLDLLHRESGERFALNLVWLLARAGGLSAHGAFDLFNAAFGFIFGLAWTLFVLKYLRDNWTRGLLLFAGLFAGVASLFTDHAEIYAPAVVFGLLFLIAMVHCVERRERRRLLALTALFLLAAKSHFANLILCVPLMVVAWDILSGREDSRITRRRILIRVLSPLLLIFAILYFFVMKNYAVSRFVDDIGRARLFFLPLIDVESNGAPIYTLFSFWHLFDFLNVMLIWSLPALLLVTAIWALYRRCLTAPPPAIVLAELALIIYAGIFFVTNPVLGMPRDWDLFMLPVPALLVYALLLARSAESARPLPRRLVGAGFGLIVLSLPFLVVNQNAALLAGRLESIGVHTYRSYWKGATYLLNVAAEQDPGTALERRVRSYAKVRPFALSADAELADLAWRISRLYRERRDYRSAEPYAADAVRASRGNELCLHELGLVQYGLGEYEAAFKTACRLSESKPQEPSYLDLAYKSALQAGDWADALIYARRYLSLRPDDAEAARLLAMIQAQSAAPSP